MFAIYHHRSIGILLDIIIVFIGYLDPMVVYGSQQPLFCHILLCLIFAMYIFHVLFNDKKYLDILNSYR